MRILKLLLFPLLVGVVGWSGNQSGGVGTHAPTHAKDGTDAVNAANLGSGAATSGQALTADGAGGNAYATMPFDVGIPGSGRNIVARSTDTNTVNFTADYMVLTNGTRTKLFSSINVSAALNAATGVGGPDVGGLDTADAFRNFCLVGKDDGTIGAVWTAATGQQPTQLPATYSWYCHAAWGRNNSSSNLFTVFRLGEMAWIGGQGGNAAVLTNGSSDTAADVDGSAWFPPGARRGILQLTLTSTSGENPAILLISKDTGETVHLFSTSVATGTVQMTVTVPLSSGRIFQYKDNGPNRQATILALGYIEE